MEGRAPDPTSASTYLRSINPLSLGAWFGHMSLLGEALARKGNFARFHGAGMQLPFPWDPLVAISALDPHESGRCGRRETDNLVWWRREQLR